MSFLLALPFLNFNLLIDYSIDISVIYAFTQNRIYSSSVSKLLDFILLKGVFYFEVVALESNRHSKTVATINLSISQSM